MNKYRIGMILAPAVLFVVWMALGNFAGQMQQGAVVTDSDIASWMGALFMLRGDVLKKYDSDLELVKSVRLPPERPSLPPEPNLSEQDGLVPEIDITEKVRFQQTTVLSTTNVSICLTADAQYIYVLHGGSIYVFDHNLNHIKTKILN